jgi:hypothetical protein
MTETSNRDRILIYKATKHASAKQLIIIEWWKIFNHHKINKLLEYLKNGMSFRYAFEKVQDL